MVEGRQHCTQNCTQRRRHGIECILVESRHTIKDVRTLDIAIGTAQGIAELLTFSFLNLQFLQPYLDKRRRVGFTTVEASIT